MNTAKRTEVRGKQEVKVVEGQKQIRSEEEVERFVKKYSKELGRTGTGGRHGRLLRYTPMSELGVGKVIVVEKIKGIQAPKPKLKTEWLTIAGCECIRLMHLVYGKKKVKVVMGKDKRNVKEGAGSGRRFYDLQVVADK